MAGLIQPNLRKAGEKRGFATMRLLTHWRDIVGADLAKLARPIKVSYSRDGFGAVLTVLSTGSNAPILQTQLPQIVERVNACYGYAAISRVRITQTAPDGFEEGQAAFTHRQPETAPPVSDAAKRDSAGAVAGIESAELRTALEQLGQHVLSRKSNIKGQK
ncbi:MAG: DciA family protein [Pseudomonadota bacterium]